MQVRELLDNSSRQVLKIPRNVTIAEAIRLMSEWKATASLVVDGEEPLVIFTERDLFRCCGRESLDVLARRPVSQAMTNKLIVVGPEENLLAAFSTMIQTDIQHLPIGEGPAITAILSIQEVARHLVSALSEELNYLQDYITIHQDAARD